MIDHYEPHIVTAQDYYPFGMLSRVALPGNDVPYKFGFNGKMNDNDVKGGLGNQQDYGLRIYDPRIGKFLSVDPLTKDYPELTPYQFASNRPIDGVDLDGGEYLKTIPKFEYSGNNTFMDYVSAIDNAVINTINLIPSTWNSGVATYQSIKRGTYAQDLRSDAKQLGSSIKQGASKFIKAPLTTLASPEGVEFITNAFIGAKIFSPVKSTGNLMKPITAEVAGAETQAAANSAKVANVKKPSSYANWGSETLDDAIRTTEQQPLYTFKTKDLRITQTLETHNEMKYLRNLKSSIEANGLSYDLPFFDQMQIFQYKGVSYLLNGHNRLAVANKLGMERITGVLIDEQYLFKRYRLTPEQVVNTSVRETKIGNKIRW